MIPKKIPKFHTGNVCKSENYEEGSKKTTVGWLKTLFLWVIVDDCFCISTQDYKDFKEACKKFRSIINISKYTSLHEWEDTTSLSKQIEALNKFREGIEDV